MEKLNGIRNISLVTIKAKKEKSLVLEKNTVSGPEDAVKIGRKLTGDSDREVFGVVTLSTANTINSIQIVAIGTISSCLVHPREVFKSAILSNAAAIVLFHNHPSGSENVSDDDLAITKKLVEAGNLLGIQVLDHVIIGNETYCSFLEKNLIGSGKNETYVHNL
ncbi:MAG TPA: JAB domain-containing protein [Thermodesulfobacteriota bacterium]|nr:JAB domain-containing protein [Thermodesulfobacteriota bacterium]